MKKGHDMVDEENTVTKTGNQSSSKGTTHTLFNTTHQAVSYTALDGKTTRYIDPKARVTIPAHDFSDELKGLVRSRVLVDETSATE